jgi:hypothetical protein
MSDRAVSLARLTELAVAPAVGTALPFDHCGPSLDSPLSPLVISTRQTLFTFSQLTSRLSVIPPSYSGAKITITITFPFTAV